MKNVKSKDSKPEVLLRKELWKHGLRYRISNKKVLGKPDIIFLRAKLAIFVDGDFWHGFQWDLKKAKLRSNLKYWIPEIERNIQRDLEVNQSLQNQGWKVIRFWEHEVLKDVGECVRVIRKYLF